MLSFCSVAPVAPVAPVSSDTDETGFHYGASLPIDKAVDVLGDAIFAYEINGEELPRDHGYPVRAIAPGHSGCR